MLEFPKVFKTFVSSLPLEPQKQTRAMNAGEPMISLAAPPASSLLDFIDILSWESVADDCIELDTTQEGYGWKCSENLPRIKVSEKSHANFLADSVGGTGNDSPVH